jgi:hypothetical protein
MRNAATLYLSPWELGSGSKKLGMMKVPITYRKYEEHGFNTPSRKMEPYSSRLKDLGYDPLPNYKEPTERALTASRSWLRNTR